MKRITVSLPQQVAAALKAETRRCGTSVSQVAREAIEARLGLTTGGRRRLPFAAIGRGGHPTTARDAEEILRPGMCG